MDHPRLKQEPGGSSSLANVPPLMAGAPVPTSSSLTVKQEPDRATRESLRRRGNSSAGGLPPHPPVLPAPSAKGPARPRSPEPASHARDHSVPRVTPASPDDLQQSRSRVFCPSLAWDLTRECQVRGFNPIFEYKDWANGQVSCSVTLAHHVISDDMPHWTFQAAKNASSEKALRIIRTWPRMNMSHLGPQWGGRLVPRHRRPLTSQPQGIKQEEAVPMLEAGTTQPTTDTPPQADLVHLLCDIAGIELPEAATNNPEMARAFLEGLATGARMTGSARSRSRSPRSDFRAAATAAAAAATGRSNNNLRRERSPVRRLPSPDLYRPGDGSPHPTGHDGRRGNEGVSGSRSSREHRSPPGGRLIPFAHHSTDRWLPPSREQNSGRDGEYRGGEGSEGRGSQHRGSYASTWLQDMRST
ncbi:hypothetical protein N0V88_006538 [Collariella sp. IMI 366227]|nr:hypothetical protein N0V88_006538 [Collariella sp. IMI 366227]